MGEQLEAEGRYVLGFMFNRLSIEGARVVLMRKNRPEWQAGKLNGVGGKVEPGETFEEAMIREFKEETGIEHSEWSPFARMRKLGAWEVMVYRAFSDRYITLASLTDEPVNIYSVAAVMGGKYPMTMNLPALLCLGLNPYLVGVVEIVESWPER